MLRITEPELMNEAEQAAAYANADFEEPHNHFIELLKSSCLEHLPTHGRALDLGCGAADISVRFARAFPNYLIDAVDGAKSMLAEAEKKLSREEKDIAERINLIEAQLQDFQVESVDYDLVFSNSLLHHLHEPNLLWHFISQFSASTNIFIMDLMRPMDEEQVNKLVNHYACNEPEILQRDFRNSLFAAFQPNEINQQLLEAGLINLQVEVVSDRHLVVKGKPGA